LVLTFSGGGVAANTKICDLTFSFSNWPDESSTPTVRAKPTVLWAPVQISGLTAATVAFAHPVVTENTLTTFALHSGNSAIGNGVFAWSYFIRMWL
jgi:hypothetical protein